MKKLYLCYFLYFIYNILDFLENFVELYRVIVLTYYQFLLFPSLSRFSFFYSSIRIISEPYLDLVQEFLPYIPYIPNIWAKFYLGSHLLKKPILNLIKIFKKFILKQLIHYLLIYQKIKISKI